MELAEWLVRWTPELVSQVRHSARSCRAIDALGSGAGLMGSMLN